MVTDNERREVAERLRELEIGVIGTVIPTGELAKNILNVIDYSHSNAMTPYGLLADLIEPSYDRDKLLNIADDLYERGDHIWELSPEMQRAFANMMYKALGVNND